MSKTLKRIMQLVSAGNIRISEHGYDELSDEGILVREIIVGLSDAVEIEDYPSYPKGACVLVGFYRGTQNPPKALKGPVENSPGQAKRARGRMFDSERAPAGAKGFI